MLKYIRTIIKGCLAGLFICQVVLGILYILLSVPYFVYTNLLALVIFFCIYSFNIFVWAKYYLKEINDSIVALVAGLLITMSPFVVGTVLFNTTYVLWICVYILLIDSLLLILRDKANVRPYRFVLAAGCLVLLIVVPSYIKGESICSDNVEEMRARRTLYPYIKQDFWSYSPDIQDKVWSGWYVEDTTYSLPMLKELFLHYEQQMGYEESKAFIAELNKLEIDMHSDEIAIQYIKDVAKNFLPELNLIKKLENGNRDKYGFFISNMWEYAPRVTILYLYSGALLIIAMNIYTLFEIAVGLIEMLRGKYKLRLIKNNFKKILPVFLLPLGALILVAIVTAIDIPGANPTIAVIAVVTNMTLPVSLYFFKPSHNFMVENI